jgi:predicted F0F1-ATPase subunit
MINSNQSPKRKDWLRAFSLTALGWELAVPIFGGLLIGYKLDQIFNTRYILTLMLLLLGIAVGYYSLYKYIELEMLRKKALERKQKIKEEII